MRDTRAPLGLSDGQVPSILAAFDLGSWGRLSDGPVASGRLGSIWRLDTERGSWAVKQVGSDEDVAELLEGAAFQEAVLAAGVATPAVRRTPAGEIIADCGGVRVRLQATATSGPTTSGAPETAGSASSTSTTPVWPTRPRSSP